jgi:hypothetical protein
MKSTSICASWLDCDVSVSVCFRAISGINITTQSSHSKLFGGPGGQARIFVSKSPNYPFEVHGLSKDVLRAWVLIMLQGWQPLTGPGTIDEEPGLRLRPPITNHRLSPL